MSTCFFATSRLRKTHDMHATELTMLHSDAPLTNFFRQSVLLLLLYSWWVFLDYFCFLWVSLLFFYFLKSSTSADYDTELTKHLS